MDKLNITSYSSITHLIEKTPCGTVYPMSIAEMNQYGDIYIEGESVLLWHYSGFSYIFGACGNDFLEHLYQQFLSSEAELSRRFILFSADSEVIEFFQKKYEIVLGKRYQFEYPEKMPSFSLALPSECQIREFDAKLFETIQGRITPHFSWRNTEEFISKGKGYCVFYDGTPASWAFSAAVSSEEIDIGIETAEMFRQRGIGMIAAERMIQYCFEQHKSPVWSCDAMNIASQIIAEKLGFVKTSEYTTIRR